jgi:PPOX class probable FMN-dependent enzyme
MGIDFEDVISTSEELRAVSRQPSDRALNKVIAELDDICRRFIAACPFVLVASRGKDGHLDVSPKGDAPGFVTVLDEKMLAIPDRPGNHRLDTFENLLFEAAVGLLFMIPGHGDTLRINGAGKIVRDRSLQDRLAVHGKVPNFILIVTVEEAFMHCSKSIVRSRLWQPEHWPDRSGLASLAEAIVAHAQPTETLSEVQTIIDRSLKNLY